MRCCNSASRIPWIRARACARPDADLVVIRVGLSGPAAPCQLLRCRNQQTLTFLTNNFTLPALTIAQIYTQRWQVKLFFESSTWCTPWYVMAFQEPFALNRPLLVSLYGSVRPLKDRFTEAEAIKPRDESLPLGRGGLESGPLPDDDGIGFSAQQRIDRRGDRLVKALEP